MGKFDEQLSRMQYLMGYKMPVNENKNGVEYSVVAADGKRYGIIKEGAKYYIKVSDANKQNIAESYEYINGILAKKENEYKSYNDATKHLELKVMSLNESHGGNVKASIFDSKCSEKVFSTLTEEARKELNRMHQIFETANTIGKNNTGNPEAPKTASFSEKIGKPFEETTKAELDKDLKATADSPEKQGEPFEKEETVTDADMESDKNPKCTDCSCKDYEDAKYVPDNSVANKKPSGGKIVKVNESTNISDDILNERDILGIDDELTDDELDGFISDDGTMYGDNVDFDENTSEENNFDDEYVIDSDELGIDNMPGPDPRFAGKKISDEDFINSIDGLPSYDNDEMRIESKLSLKRIVESVCDNIIKQNINEIGDTLKGQNKLGKLAKRKNMQGDEQGFTDVDTYAMNRQYEKYPEKYKNGSYQERPFNDIKRGAYQSAYDHGYLGTKGFLKDRFTNESFTDKLTRIIKEEMTNLGVWGKHPGYRKKPMTTPSNTEVIKTKGDKDWNDDSVKGEKPFGQKIGCSAPYDEVVNMLTDAVMKNITESLKKK